RSEDLRAERPQPGLGLHERLRHRRRVHGLVGLPESVVDVHGADGASRSVRRRRAEAGEFVTLTRRDVLRHVTGLIGGVALVGGDRLLALSFDDGALAQATAQGTSLFSPADVALLDEIAETMLPETSTPGAKAAKTGAFMALMVTDAYTERAQQVFRAGLIYVDELCRKTHAVPFMEATPAQRLAIVETLDREQKGAMDAHTPGPVLRPAAAPLPPRCSAGFRSRCRPAASRAAGAVASVPAGCAGRQGGAIPLRRSWRPINRGGLTQDHLVAFLLRGALPPTHLSVG